MKTKYKLKKNILYVVATGDTDSTDLGTFSNATHTSAFGTYYSDELKEDNYKKVMRELAKVSEMEELKFDSMFDIGESSFATVVSGRTHQKTRGIIWTSFVEVEQAFQNKVITTESGCKFNLVEVKRASRYADKILFIQGGKGIIKYLYKKKVPLIIIKQNEHVKIPNLARGAVIFDSTVDKLPDTVNLVINNRLKSFTFTELLTGIKNKTIRRLR